MQKIKKWLAIFLIVIVWKKKYNRLFLSSVQYTIVLTYSHTNYTRTVISTKTIGDGTLNAYFKHLFYKNHKLKIKTYCTYKIFKKIMFNILHLNAKFHIFKRYILLSNHSKNQFLYYKQFVISTNNRTQNFTIYYQNLATTSF